LENNFGGEQALWTWIPVRQTSASTLTSLFFSTRDGGGHFDADSSGRANGAKGVSSHKRRGCGDGFSFCSSAAICWAACLIARGLKKYAIPQFLTSRLANSFEVYLVLFLGSMQESLG
jgi:hypothetical protein